MLSYSEGWFLVKTFDLEQSKTHCRPQYIGSGSANLPFLFVQDMYPCSSPSSHPCSSATSLQSDNILSLVPRYHCKVSGDTEHPGRDTHTVTTAGHLNIVQNKLLELTFNGSNYSSCFDQISSKDMTIKPRNRKTVEGM